MNLRWLKIADEKLATSRRLLWCMIARELAMELQTNDYVGLIWSLCR
jgi:hypothetical protein